MNTASREGRSGVTLSVTQKEYDQLTEKELKTFNYEVAKVTTRVPTHVNTIRRSDRLEIPEFE